MAHLVVLRRTISGATPPHSVQRSERSPNAGDVRELTAQTVGGSGGMK